MDKAYPSSLKPTLDTSAEAPFSFFSRAFEIYLNSLPKHKKKSEFIQLCRDAGTNAHSINDLQKKEALCALSGPAQKIFFKVMKAITDYSEVIGQIVSAQPLPCAIIWGALKVVVEASNRCSSMFENMQKELKSLAVYLQHITMYKELYGESEEMQLLLLESYTSIIRFWHRVHKECKHRGLATLARALSSSAQEKMNACISEIHSASTRIQEVALLSQAQKDKQEYNEARAERKLQNEWRERQSVSDYFNRCEQIRNFLTPVDIVGPNLQCHESNLRHLQPETCQWLTEESCYTTWCGSSSDSPRIFSLSGPPGYGKTTLTSFAIRDLESKGAAVAYYFCQFSQPCKTPFEILRLLGLQLFNIYFERQLPLDYDFVHRISQNRSSEVVQDAINELVLRLLSRPGGVYFFIDGLDEAVDSGISPVLEYLIGLLKDWATDEVGEVCLWVTKRRQEIRPVVCHEKHIQPEPKLTLELADHTHADVVRFLRAKLQALKQRISPQQSCDLSEEHNALFCAAEFFLILRAQGNFLWARVMTQDFDGENRVEDIEGLLKHILGDMPEELTNLYKGRFDRFDRLERNDKRIAIKVMSLVAFARRQLRIEELQEAAAMLASYGKKNKAASDAIQTIRNMPLKVFLAKYTTLVEVDGDMSNPAPTNTCRLVHSTVFEFLIENPAILDKDLKDNQLHFTPFALANACLIYLVRPVFSQLLQKQSISDTAYTWVDSAGSIVDKQVFAQYAAKYWVRHVEDISKREQDQIRNRVIEFVKSNNFQTCMQIQSIWVEGRFNEYYVDGQLSLLRALPEWLIKCSSDIKCSTTGMTKYWSDYRELMHNWKILLSCQACHDSPDCFYLPFKGELDRIWWSTFGPDHVFSDFQSRYKSFRLIEGKNTCSEYFEAISVSKEHIVIVRLENWSRFNGSLQFACEHWILSDYVSAPTLGKTQVITTTEDATNWLLYAKPPAEGLARLMARPTAISDDAQILRLGSQLFRRDKDNDYRVASSGDAPAYFEEISARGALVAIGSRSHALATQLQEPYRLFESLGKDFIRLERLENRKDTKDGKFCTICESDESDDDWLSEASSDSSDVETEAYESWSEGSTDDEGYAFSDSSESLVSEHGSEADSEEDSTSGLAGVDSIPSEASSFISHSAFPDPGRFNDIDSVSEEELWGMEVDARLKVPTYNKFMRSPNTREPTVLLTVLQYDDNSMPTKLFEYSCPLQFMLYDSPPAVHPRESLVVWSLGGGNLLFADVAARTYFTRQLRPSAPHTRQILVKPQFSACGHFLHVATLEVRVQAIEHNRQSKDRLYSIHRPPPDLHLYMLVLTYRLSSRKPTRSPPVLLYRVKVDLGKHEGPLSVSRLPFSFTWTPNELFVSRRGAYLDVFRIQLFSKNSSDHCPSEQPHNVLVPKKKTLLPDSSVSRDVHFVPLSDDNNGASMVVIGSETWAKPEAVLIEDLVQPGVMDTVENEASYVHKRRTLAPSIGTILQAEDICGWIQAEGILVPEGRSMGHLDMRKEKFDPIDDCDAEPY